MDKEEGAKLLIAGIVGFYIGHIVGDIRRQRYIKLRQKRRYADNRSDDVLKTLQAWFEDTSDERPLKKVIEDWYYNTQFKEIVNGE